MWFGRIISLACTAIGGATIGYLYVWDQNGPDQNRSFNCMLPKSYYYFDKGKLTSWPVQMLNPYSPSDMSKKLECKLKKMAMSGIQQLVIFYPLVCLIL